jgi:hypothetical protein
MSKGLADDASKLEWRKVDELRDEFGVDFHPSTVGRAENHIAMIRRRHV